MDTLLTSLATKYVECTLPNVQDGHSVPSISLDEDGLAEAIDKLMVKEEEIHKSYQCFSRQPGCSWHNRVREPNSVISYSKFQTARLFLSHMGYFAFDQLRDTDFYLLNKSPNLIRDIRGLDKKYSREVAKIAVFYTNDQVTDEQSILKNHSSTQDYKDFILSLGWPVSLESHPGYKGGLEAEMMIDGLATYYCTSTQEIIFHDATCMLSDSQDPKQLKKKRHIGNDHVHIIWNDKDSDYKVDTIGGDFGNAQIVITPLSNGLYTIDIFKDSQLSNFGLLQSRSVVTKAALGPLVRFTSMAAHRVALAAHSGNEKSEPHPFDTRKETIEVISNRHCGSRSFESFMNQLIGEN